MTINSVLAALVSGISLEPYNGEAPAEVSLLLEKIKDKWPVEDTRKIVFNIIDCALLCDETTADTSFNKGNMYYMDWPYERISNEGMDIMFENMVDVGIFNKTNGEYSGSTVILNNKEQFKALCQALCKDEEEPDGVALHDSGMPPP